VTSAQTLALDRGKARADRQHRLSRHRDRALIGLLVYSFARIGAALGMAVEDVYTQNRRLWVTPREKGGKRHRIRAIKTSRNTSTAISTAPACAAIQRGRCSARSAAAPACVCNDPRVAAAGIATKFGNHSFRATGITAYLNNGGTLEKAGQWQTMPRRARRSSMTGGDDLTSMRPSGL